MGGDRIAVAILVALTAVACDSRAKAADPIAARPEAKSKEYESCGASMHCQDDLRCFDNTCRRGSRSNVGDYYAALGAAARDRGELEAAVDSYNKALGHYDSEKIALPPDVDCAYGTTLAAARAKKEHAELAARVLHRCVLAVPMASPLRQRALADLAQLTEAGLDPLTLGRTQLADVYLTRAPQAPALDKLQISFSTNPPVEGKKTFPLVTERLSQTDIKGPLIQCWQAYNKDTKKDTLAVSLGLKWTYAPSEYEDEPGKFSSKIEPPAGLAGADLAADQCVRGVVEPALKALNTVRDAFTTKLTITVK